MSKEEAVLYYKTLMSTFKKYAAEGLLSSKELLELDTIIADEYGISLSSIYREHDLLFVPNRANIP